MTIMFWYRPRRIRKPSSERSNSQPSDQVRSLPSSRSPIAFTVQERTRTLKNGNVVRYHAAILLHRHDDGVVHEYECEHRHRTVEAAWSCMVRWRRERENSGYLVVEKEAMA